MKKNDPEKLIKESNAFSEYGTFCHSICEQYANNKLEIYELVDYYQKYYNQSVTSTFPYNRYVDLNEEYYNDGLKFFSNFDGLDDYHILNVEHRFKYPIHNYGVLMGIIDLVYKDSNNNLIIHDWKSKSKFKDDKELKEFTRQLYLYSVEVFNQFGKYPDVLRFYLFRKGEPINVEFKYDELKETLEWFKSSILDIKNCKEWPPTYNPFFCKNLCAYKSSCPYLLGGMKDIN